jgi:hypothetical protein
MIITYYILSIFIAMLLGALEGLMFCGYVGKEHISEFWKRKTKLDIHVFLTLIRIFIYLPMFVSLMFPNNIFYFGAVISMFPFFHDGQYYYTRHLLDGAYTGWKDESNTTSAKSSLSYKERVIALVISVCLIILGVII